MKEVIIHHHLGMGDHFVCNGIINLLSKKFEIIHLACKSSNYTTISLLYSDNKKVKIFKIQDEFKDVAEYQANTKLPILRIGFDRCNPLEWNTSFYAQLGIEFFERYNSFHMPENIPDEVSIFNKFYNHKDYCLIHREASTGKYNLKIQSNLEKIEIEKNTDPYGNILNYRKLINNAKEIHCINSSLFHFVDSLSPKCKLVYHDVRKLDFKIDDKKWEVVNYD